MNSVIILEDLVFKSTLSRRKRILDNQIRSRGGLMVTSVVFIREEADRQVPYSAIAEFPEKKLTLPKWADKNSELENLGDTKSFGKCMNKYPVVQGWLHQKRFS